jgi:hypothetical protein
MPPDKIRSAKFRLALRAPELTARGPRTARWALVVAAADSRAAARRSTRSSTRAARWRRTRPGGGGGATAARWRRTSSRSGAAGGPPLRGVVPVYPLLSHRTALHICGTIRQREIVWQRK